ncbi:DUF3124 domain-containing protein [Parasulfuritortus cantonensis]|uniref:DUF3124 domain-containing protein n=1 Tax=Parasulfuritortus cantonensis TaxID=2528202 RepID=A0A4R1B7Q9_9PROT|nr:DUF3124 domain-containing protein [Parasulfuritortus cantonensis]TCJ11769.1 DUF3124 domain-containing protein [Parasulfuritortus cantonensis]
MRTLVLLVLLLSVGLARAEEAAFSTGQTLYLPIYSHLPYGNRVAADKPGLYPLSILVSLRNTDPRQPIRLTSARYYDTNGKLLREYLNAPRTLAPLATLELFLERNDLAGGSGANFLIAWQADKPVNVPIVEAVHADVTGNRTLSFVTSARPVR